MRKVLFLMIALMSVIACKNSETPQTLQSLTLSADKSEILADGEQIVTFTIKDDKQAIVEDALIYYATTNEPLGGKTFCTEIAGDYKFYAQKGDIKSNIVSITANVVESPDQTVILKVEPATIVADGVQTATFSVTFNGEAVDATIYNAEDESPLEGNTFTTTTAGEYTFFALYQETRSNVVKVSATEATIPDEDELYLSANKTSIIANGEDMISFTTLLNTEAVAAVIYNAADDSALEGTTFTTTQAGTYTFYAQYNDIISNEIEITATEEVVEEKPIEISASTTTIKANGVDNVIFTVYQEGSDVTAQSSIYVNGGVLNGNKFVTTTPGQYTVYATKGGVTSDEIIITAEEVTESGKTIVFAEGVTLTSGWYDVNKVGMGDNGDINMCWAATSSNMIQWFQDRYVAAGNTLPETAVSGPGKDGTYELALMDMYHDEWDNSRGGHMQEAIPWYFEGVLNGGEYASPGSQAVPLTDGGYWKDIWDSEVYPNIYHGYENIVVPGLIEYKDIYVTIYNNYYIWGNGTDYLGTERLKIFSDIVVETFSHGMAGLVINLNANLTSSSHAVTLWGYEIDNATGLLTRVWITDSDDLTTEPKDKLLNEYSVSIGDGKSSIKLTGDTRYGACWIVSIHPFSGYGTGSHNQ